ncbi:hypothetical protein [Sneathiella aquimaris]|uniref:hypothetical protein n=1 Tax=Sneathiella aquimaris TaxID=2599305 RepID=UPI00146F600F|nr:hypothetical protein [Sneathiella aquimaris]
MIKKGPVHSIHEMFDEDAAVASGAFSIPANDNFPLHLVDAEQEPANDNVTALESQSLLAQTGITPVFEESELDLGEDRFYDGQTIRELDFSQEGSGARGFLSEV